MSQKREKKKRKRAEREREYTLRKAAEAAQIPAGYSTPVMQHFVFDSPFDVLSNEERRALLKNAGDNAEIAFATGVDALEHLIRKHTPTELLAAIAFYTLFQGVDSDTDFTEPSPFPQALAETLQSLSLRHPADQFENQPVLSDTLGKVLDGLKHCAECFARKRYTALAGAEENEKHLLFAIEGARLHTQMLRNWGYPQHMRVIVAELFAPLDEPIRKALGFSATQLVALTSGIHTTVGERASAFLQGFGQAFRQKSKKAVVTEFCKLARVSREDEAGMQEFVASRSISNRNLKLLLFSYFHQKMPAIFSFTIDDCLGLIPSGGDVRRLKSILDALSMSFGALAETPSEHLFMQSEIRTKPFVRVGDGIYFVPVAGLLHSNVVEVLESLFFGTTSLKDAYHPRRADYLEESVERLVRGAFPVCPVHAGTQWTDLNDGKEYENDCVAIIGPVAIIFEAKSERVEDAARRGARNTLKNHYKSLVREPATQATRFAQVLENGHGVQQFRTTNGTTYELDLSLIRRAVCVSVTLDWFPAAGMCWRHLLSAGLVGERERPTLHLSLADLRVLTEVLTRPDTLLHYFWRRAEWEGCVDYLGDEGDLLVYYLSEGLTIAPPLRDGKSVITLYGRSDELHRFYMAEWAAAETSVPRPRRLLGAWWEAVLNRVGSRPLAQKWDIACVLLDLSYQQQEEFAKRFLDLVGSVLRGGKENGLLFAGSNSESRGAVVGFVYRSLTYDQRNAQASDLAAQAHARFGADRVVVIGRDVDHRGAPYSFLALVDHTGQNGSEDVAVANISLDHSATDGP